MPAVRTGTSASPGVPVSAELRARPRVHAPDPGFEPGIRVAERLVVAQDPVEELVVVVLERQCRVLEEREGGAVRGAELVRQQVVADCAAFPFLKYATL